MKHLSRRRWHFLGLLLMLLWGSTFLNQQVQAQAPYVWGWNGFSQLGDGTNIDSYIPKNIASPGGTVAVSAGGRHSLAVNSDGTVWAWGNNQYGQLGDGTNNNSSVPVKVLGLSGVVQVSAGTNHSLALKSDGTVWAWGYNDTGKLGNGTDNNSNLPVQVVGLSGVIQVSAGRLHSLALKLNGTVWAWGLNLAGELGDGTDNNSNLPVQVVGLSGVIQVSAGGSHSLALKSDGNVWSWGYNAYGQLGNGNNSSNESHVPIQSKATGVTQIATGDFYSIALASDGTVWIWGVINYGQLGIGPFSTSYFPIQIAKITNAVLIASGIRHFVVLSVDSNLWSWGYNHYGQLGNGTNTDSYVPVRVSGLTSVQGITVISGGEQHTLAVGTSKDAKVTVPNVTAPYGATALKATVTLDKTGFPMVRRQAAFSVDGKVVAYATSDASGTFTTPPMTFSVGTHKLQVNVAGYGAFNPGVGNGTLLVTKSSTTLKARNVVMTLGETRDLTATLTQKSDGAPVQGAKITFTLNGTTMGSANTDSNGLATFAYKSDGTLPVGTYKIGVSFAGDASRNATKASATLTINKRSTRLTQKSITAKPSTTVNLAATLLRSSDGIALSNQSLTFYVAGVLIGTGTTDAKGVAVVSFTTSASSGTYPLKVTFEGDASYAKSSYSKAVLTVK